MRRLLWPLPVLFLLCDTILAQSPIPQREMTKEGVVKFHRFSDTLPKKLSQSRAVLKELLALSATDSLGLQNTVTENGRTHQLFQQYYKGYKVQDATYAVHAKYGDIETANGFFQRLVNVPTEIKIDKKTALATALDAVHAVKYGWEDPFTEKLYRQQTNNPQATLYPSPELVIYRDDSIAHGHRLVYKWHIYAVQPFSDNNIYVDAITGKVLARENLVQMDNATGTGRTLYSYTENITMDSYGSPVQYRLRETRSGNAGTAQIQTLNMQTAGGSYSAATDFSNTSTSWTTADASQDVHWGTEKVFDYWSNIRGRNSYNGTGGNLLGYVHADLHAINSRYTDNDNAFWDRTLLSMTYGDGTTQFNAVTSLDVVAHEIGHGICQFTAALGNSGESPALNEGLSDIWGAVIENYAASWKQPWKIGEDIMKNGKPCLRSLQSPKTGGSLPNPDTYHGANWDYGNEPHTNSTVLSHWFYLLSQGGSGTNDLGNAYNVTGIGITAAARIVWNAESTGKLQTASQYSDARTAMINAAIDEFGACTGELVQVTNAWYAVGIGAAITINSSYAVTGTSPVCTTRSYSVANLPGGSTVIWNTRNPYPQGPSMSFSPVNGNPTTITYLTGPGVDVPVYATMVVPGTGCVSTPTRTIHLGQPASVSLTGIQLVPRPYYGITATVVTDAPPPYNWYIDGVLKKTTTSTSSDVVVAGQCGVMHSFQVGVNNGCGEIRTLPYSFSNTCGMRMAVMADSGNAVVSSLSGRYLLSPNPVRSAGVHVAQQDRNLPGMRRIIIYTAAGTAVKVISYGPETRQSDINTAGLSAGVYFLEIFDGALYERKKLVVQK